MNMLVRPAADPDPPAKVEGEEGEGEGEEIAPPALELDTLTTTVWSGTAAPSDHNLVLRERIRVLEEDVTVRASLRVAVSDPSINLRCSIQVQHPAFPPVDEAGAVGEPPKATTITAYGRRQHWIDSLETRSVYHGTGEVRIPYICFSPGIVYILHIESTEPIADPESLKWTMHGFYNGEAGGTPRSRSGGPRRGASGDGGEGHREPREVPRGPRETRRVEGERGRPTGLRVRARRSDRPPGAP